MPALIVSYTPRCCRGFGLPVGIGRSMAMSVGPCAAILCRACWMYRLAEAAGAFVVWACLRGVWAWPC